MELSLELVADMMTLLTKRLENAEEADRGTAKAIEDVKVMLGMAMAPVKAKLAELDKVVGDVAVEVKKAVELLGAKSEEALKNSNEVRSDLNKMAERVSKMADKVVDVSNDVSILESDVLVKLNKLEKHANDLDVKVNAQGPEVALRMLKERL